jgi:hypothetical protein
VYQLFFGWNWNWTCNATPICSHGGRHYTRSLFDMSIISVFPVSSSPGSISAVDITASSIFATLRLGRQ